MTMSGVSYAPWTDDQVAALARRQARPDLHPYTCANGRDPLTPERAGWRCVTCDFRQGWAWEVDTLPVHPVAPPNALTGRAYDGDTGSSVSPSAESASTSTNRPGV